jgi:hypothetical protein
MPGQLSHTGPVISALVPSPVPHRPAALHAAVPHQMPRRSALLPPAVPRARHRCWGYRRGRRRRPEAARMAVAQPDHKRGPRHAPVSPEDGAGRFAAPAGAAPGRYTQRIRTGTTRRPSFALSWRQCGRHRRQPRPAGTAGTGREPAGHPLTDAESPRTPDPGWAGNDAAGSPGHAGGTPKDPRDRPTGFLVTVNRRELCIRYFARPGPVPRRPAAARPFIGGGEPAGRGPGVDDGAAGSPGRVWDTTRGHGPHPGWSATGSPAL